MLEKYLSYFLSRSIIIFSLGIIPLNVNCQNNNPNLEFEYASTLFLNNNFGLAAELYNKIVQNNLNVRYELLYPALTNFKTGNDSLFLFWLNKFVEYNYTIEINLDKYKNILNNDELNYLYETIYNLKYNISKDKIAELNFSLYNIIKNTSSIDQFIRISGIISPSESKKIDSIYIFEELMDILYEDFQIFDIQDAQLDLYVILIHQTDYKSNFEKILKLGFLEKLLSRNILTPFQYAYIIDTYLERNNKPLMYGTLFTIGKISNMEGYNLSEVNIKRKEINLCELEFDSRNVLPILEKDYNLLIILVKSILKIN